MNTPTFALHDLGWYAFQQLCHTVMRDALGQTVESFSPSNDEGRDGYFRGTWEQVGGETLHGSFVIQCKHTTVPNKNLTLSEMEEDLEKAELLAKRKLCDNYILMTNCAVSGRSARLIGEKLAGYGIDEYRIFEKSWFNATLLESPKLRRQIPRIYGIGDLKQILNTRAYEQADKILDTMRGNLKTLVLTSTYDKALKAIDSHGLVFLLGGPATGKTTIAAQLALSALDSEDANVVVLDSIKELKEKWDPDERQLFWIDDAFGATQYRSSRAAEWSQALHRIESAIDSGNHLIVTSRDYIFAAARESIKLSSFPQLDLGKVTVDVRKLTLEEREQILYNHLRHGKQPNYWLRRLLPNLEAAASHSGFTPELARRLANPHFTKHINPANPDSVSNFFSEPKSFLRTTIQELDKNAKAALGLIFIHQGQLISPIERNTLNEDFVARADSTIGSAIKALESMEHSLVMQSRVGDLPCWSFSHPTMADAYAEIMRSPDLIEHLLFGMPLESLLDEITCGDVGIEGAIIVDSRHYAIVLDRIRGSVVSDQQNFSSWTDPRWRFLTDRCTVDFLRSWVDENPMEVQSISTANLKVYAWASNHLFMRLIREGCVSEDQRSSFSTSLKEACLKYYDFDPLLDERWRAAFTDQEFEELRSGLLELLTPCPHSFFEDFIVDFDTDDPDSVYWLEPLESLAGELVELYPEVEGIDEIAEMLADDVSSLRTEIEQMEHERPSHAEIRASESDMIDHIRPRQRSRFDDLVEHRDDINR